MTGDEFAKRAAGLLANEAGLLASLPPETKNWVAVGGFCCCQDSGECPALDYDTRVVNFDDFETTGTGEPCPLGKTKCCFSDRKLVKQFQVSLDGFLE